MGSFKFGIISFLKSETFGSYNKLVPGPLRRWFREEIDERRFLLLQEFS